MNSRVVFFLLLPLFGAPCATTPRPTDGTGADAGAGVDAGVVAWDAGTIAATCYPWVAAQSGAGISVPPGQGANQRASLLDAGGGLRAVEGSYYAMWFPASWAGAPTRRVLVALHGTSGYPEAEWNGWQRYLEPRSWGFIGVSYYQAQDGGSYDDDVTIYRHITQAFDEVNAYCNLAPAQISLLGFSRGSAMSYPVSYLDADGGRRLFTGVIANSGAWPPPDGGVEPLYPTLAGIKDRNETSAYAGVKFWMYCGDADDDHGWAMCWEMDNARSWLMTYGATVQPIYRGFDGGHGSLVEQPDAAVTGLKYLETLK
ncbi:MAG: hypothetical protein HYY84_13435 [Deltaproteobacteria bacterium]|nr:hypothetical protein [Deltaproteobacteria bacterium]